MGEDQPQPQDPAVAALQNLNKAAQISRHSDAVELARDAKAAADALPNGDQQNTRNQLVNLARVLHNPGWPDVAHDLAHSLEINPTSITKTNEIMSPVEVPPFLWRHAL